MAGVTKHLLPSGEPRYHVRWREKVVTQAPDGTVRTRWKNRTRSCRTRKAAERLAREIELAADQGRRWKAEVEVPTVTLDTLAVAYVRAAARGDARQATVRFRASMVEAFLAFAGRDRSASDLSMALLEAYASALPKDGRKQGTRYRKLREVERMWTWAEERPAQFPGVPRPRRLTGTAADRVQAPQPVVALDVPQWADADRMIAHLDQRPWHRQAALVMRYHGLRVSQVLGLDWRDLDLGAGLLRVRAGLRGAKKGRTRVVPLHPSLAADMASWNQAPGLLFRRKDGTPWRGDTLLAPFRRAWVRSGVAPSKWGVATGEQRLPGDRAHGRPTHALRACFRSGLIRAGVEEAIALYLAGHSQGLTAAAYVPEDHPETSPFWPAMAEAIGKVPPVEDHG